MEESRKRSSSERDYSDLTVYCTGKRPRSTTTSSETLTFEEEEEGLMMMITSEEEEEEDLLAAGFPIQEEMVKQVMKVLEEELRSPNKKIFQASSSSASSYITINNYNEESCGPSISDSSSSVMASMDIGSINIAYLLSFSEKFWANNSLILPAPALSANVEQLLFPRNEQQFSVNEIINRGESGDQNQKQNQDEEEEESVDEWINRVLNGDLLEFDDDDDDFLV